MGGHTEDGSSWAHMVLDIVVMSTGLGLGLGALTVSGLWVG
ncbi:hypothetical protein [Streptomyces sp. NPDC052496]